VDLLTHLLKVGELLVGLDALERPASFLLPGVVDVDVLPTVIDQPAGGHGAGRVDDILACDAPVIGVPTVPTHGRRQGDRLADHDLEPPIMGPQGVLGAQCDHVLAGFVQGTCDQACLGVHGQTCRQRFDGELHGPCSRGRDLIEKRVSRPHTEDRRAVDPRRVGWFGRADLRVRNTRLGHGPARAGPTGSGHKGHDGEYSQYAGTTAAFHRESSPVSASSIE